jgi:hypothetical protein
VHSRFKSERITVLIVRKQFKSKLSYTQECGPPLMSNNRELIGTKVILNAKKIIYHEEKRSTCRFSIRDELILLQN